MTEHNILSTITYYDVLVKPLTAWEIFKCLIRHPRERNKPNEAKIRFSDVRATLENSAYLKEKISQKNGFYFLKGRENIVQERIEKQKEAERKWKKARRVIKWLQVIPFIRLIMISGSLAQNNTAVKSDIDLLIVAQSGRIWTCRGLITVFLHLIGQRRHGTHIENRFCLNHYLTTDSLAIPNESLYNAQTYIHLTPIWQTGDDFYRKFQEANQWLKKYLFFYPLAQKGYLKRKTKPVKILSVLRNIGELILSGAVGKITEWIFKNIQIKKIKRNSNTNQSGGRIVVSDKQLEFHPRSPEKNIILDYNRKIRELGLSDWGREENSGLTK